MWFSIYNFRYKAIEYKIF